MQLWDVGRHVINDFRLLDWRNIQRHSFSVLAVVMIGASIVTDCSHATVTPSSSRMARSVIHEDHFRQLNQQVWRLGSVREYSIVPYGLRLYTTYFETALIWYRQPVPADVEIVLDFKHMGGGHPLVVLLNSLGVGGSVDTGYTIEIGTADGANPSTANAQGVIRRLGEVVATSPRGVLAYQERQTLKVVKSENRIQCWLDGDAVLDYIDPDPLTGESCRHFGIGLGKHYVTPHTHGNTELLLGGVTIRPFAPIQSGQSGAK